jgi:O-antigen ligase
VWKGQEVVAFLEQHFNSHRAQSLGYRLECEELLRERAWQRPWFGWGGWNRGRVYDEYGNDLAVTDGRWIIALGDRGLVGLLALFAALLLPPLRFASLFPPWRWSEPAVAPVAAAAIAVLIFSIDSLLNAGIDHLFPFMAGGLIGLNPKHFAAREAVRANRASRLRPRLETAV